MFMFSDIIKTLDIDFLQILGSDHSQTKCPDMLRSENREVLMTLQIFYVLTIVKQKSVISNSTLPHWSAWVDLICFLVNTQAFYLFISSTFYAGYCHSVGIGRFSFFNIIIWIMIPLCYAVCLVTFDTQSFVIMPGTTIPILPASLRKVDQSFILGLNIRSTLIRNFFFYDPSVPISLKIYLCHMIS